MNLNQELHEALGYCWHEQYDTELLECSKCGASLLFPCDRNPDYVADPRLVIIEMEKREDGKLFFAKLIYDGENVEGIDDDGLIDRKLVTSTKGELALLALKWLRKQKK